MLKWVINGLYLLPRVNRIIQLVFLVLAFIVGYYIGQHRLENDVNKLALDLRNNDRYTRLAYIKKCKTSSNEPYAPCSSERDGQLPIDHEKISSEQTNLNQNINFRSVVAKDSESKMFDLLIVIPSAANNTERRKAIRETWLRLHPANKSDISIKHYFIIGTKDVETEQQERLIEEQLMYRDLMILSTCGNGFSQLTEKLLTSYYWLVKTITFRYMLKVDDDSFARLDILSQELKGMTINNDNTKESDILDKRFDTSSYTHFQHENETRKMLYWGYFDGRAPVFRSGKWGEKTWFLCNNYLPYALGGGYIVSSDIVNILASLSPYLQLYLNEDVSMGVWLAPFANIERKHDRRFDTEARPRGCSNQHIISHHLTVEEIYSRYNNLIKGQYYCSSQYQLSLSYEYNWNSLPSDCCRRGFRDY